MGTKIQQTPKPNQHVNAAWKYKIYIVYIKLLCTNLKQGVASMPIGITEDRALGEIF